VEIAKCDKKLDLAKLNLQKIVKLESQPDYAATVPANVQAANSDKVRFVIAAKYRMTDWWCSGKQSRPKSRP
jgi:valyl-tRNA synthetase